MAGSLTDAGEVLALDLVNGGTQTITLPLKLALMTAAGSEASAGTEVTGGSYARQSITMGSSSTSSGTTSAANTNAITFPSMPAVTTAGWEIYDSSATPKRIWFGTATSVSRTWVAGDTATVAIGAIVLGMD